MINYGRPRLLDKEISKAGLTKVETRYETITESIKENSTTKEPHKWEKQNQQELDKKRRFMASYIQYLTVIDAEKMAN